MFDLNGNFIREFPSGKEASEATGYPVYLIQRNANGQNYTCGDHLFSYDDTPRFPGEGLVRYERNGCSVYRRDRSIRPIMQYDSLGNYIQTFNGVQEAAAETNLDAHAIYKSAANPNTLGGGFYWMYDDRRYELKPHKNYAPKRVRHIETGVVYENGREAARATGIDAKLISKNCRGDRKSAKGQHFEFADQT